MSRARAWTAAEAANATRRKAAGVARGLWGKLVSVEPKGPVGVRDMPGPKESGDTWE